MEYLERFLTLIATAGENPKNALAFIGVIGIMAGAINVLLILGFRPVGVGAGVRAYLMLSVILVSIRWLIAAVAAQPIGIDWTAVFIFGNFVVSLIFYGLGIIRAVENNRRLIRRQIEKRRRELLS